MPERGQRRYWGVNLLSSVHCHPVPELGEFRFQKTNLMSLGQQASLVNLKYRLWVYWGHWVVELVPPGVLAVPVLGRLHFVLAAGLEQVRYQDHWDVHQCLNQQEGRVTIQLRDSTTVKLDLSLALARFGDSQLDFLRCSLEGMQAGSVR